MTISRARVAGVAATIAALPFLMPTAAGATNAPDSRPAHHCPVEEHTPDSERLVVDTADAAADVSATDDLRLPRKDEPKDEPKHEPKDEPKHDCDEASEPWVFAEKSCAEIVLWLGNNGDAPAVLKVFVDGNRYDYTIAPGTKYDKHIPVTEDSTVALKVRDGDKVDTGAGEDIVYAEKVTTDCVQPVETTTTVKSTVQPVLTPVVTPTTTAVPTEVLGIQVVTPEPAAQLARTGSQSTTNAGVGVSLLGLGLGLVTLGRRRKAQI